MSMQATFRLVDIDEFCADPIGVLSQLNETGAVVLVTSYDIPKVAIWPWRIKSVGGHGTRWLRLGEFCKLASDLITNVEAHGQITVMNQDPEPFPIAVVEGINQTQIQIGIKSMAKSGFFDSPRPGTGPVGVPSSFASANENRH